jgi:hypothetical protein
MIRKCRVIVVIFCFILLSTVLAQSGHFPRIPKTIRKVVKKSHSARKRAAHRHQICLRKRKVTSSNHEDQGEVLSSSSKNSNSSLSRMNESDASVKKAGEFNGDLRELPKTKPADQERPKREDPPFKPKPAPTPIVKPPNQ